MSLIVASFMARTMVGMTDGGTFISCRKKQIRKHRQATKRAKEQVTE